MEVKTFWISEVPAGCQLSGKPFNGVMYDANLPGLGWGLWNADTFLDRGGKLGAGFGQKYRLQDNGAWLKVAG